MWSAGNGRHLFFFKILKKPIFRLNRGVYQKKSWSKPHLKFNFLPYRLIFSSQSTLSSVETSTVFFKGWVWWVGSSHDQFRGFFVLYINWRLYEDDLSDKKYPFRISQFCHKNFTFQGCAFLTKWCLYLNLLIMLN